MYNNKYSFILPAYKAKYLSIAIKSILNQTYTNFELVVVDDASPEDLKSIVESFSDNRVFYFRNPVNLGGESLCNNWHHCLKYVKGEYMILASDDDVFEKDFLHYVDKYVIKYPECDIIRCNTRIINGHGNIEKEDCSFTTCKVSLADYLDKYFLNQVRCIANTVYKSKWILEHGFSVYDLAWHSDNMTAFQAAKNNGIVLIGDKVLFNFRVSGINISSSITNSSVLRKSKATSIYYSDLVRLINELPISLKKIRLRFKYMRTARLLFYGYICNVGFEAIKDDILQCKIFNPLGKLILLSLKIKKVH